jgi:hypothetical protein
MKRAKPLAPFSMLASASSKAVLVDLLTTVTIIPIGFPDLFEQS